MSVKKIGLISLGCPKNLVDSEEMAGRLRKAGYRLTGDEREADLILINTCGFIESAREESIDTILEYCRRKEAGDLEGVIVTGCLAERYRAELEKEIPEVDAFLTLSEESRIVAGIDRILHEEGSGMTEEPDHAPVARTLLTPFYTAYLKISEGCSHRCSYCTIPLIRGPHRSRDRSELIEEAKGLVDQGVRELIVIGQDITRFGSDRGEPNALPVLLQELSGIEGVRWIRLMYLHPDHLSDELIGFVASEKKVLPYLDLPVQHISDPILKKMHRKVTAEDLYRRIGKVREILPDVVLRTSLIVGFPGEGEGDFHTLCDFVREVRFHHVGVFEYSREEGTSAALLPDPVPPEVRKERRGILMEIQAGISGERNEERIGRTLEVLVEGHSSETDLLLAGRYYGQAPEIDGQVLINEGNAEVGEFYDVRITDAHTYDLVGAIVE
ncbi:MAG: 30S ribosomal protein S12 methylthiotransferase RimO [Deltaproteobacteria bacterium]|nr:30S ribosomal protein S12 methylthiotransferase RimO [Deltaproteobacteria bacterium]